MPEIIIVFLLAAVLAYMIYDTRQKSCLLDQKVASLVRCNDDMRNTLVYGLSARFGGGEGKDDLYDFEQFVAEILQRIAGGKARVTLISGDYGVDIEHRLEGKLYLGQVRCCTNKVDFEPVAIIHSQIVKQKADGGLIVTTSDFTANARAYAKGLAIELINGKDLVSLWLQAVEAERSSSAKLALKPNQA